MTVTKRENFESIKTILVAANADPALIAFVNHELELLSKKSSNRKPSKSQTLTTNITEIVLNTVQNATYPLSAAEIQQTDDRLKNFNGEEITSSRIVAILNKFIATSATFSGQDLIKKTVIKRKTYYGTIDTINNKRPE